MSEQTFEKAVLPFTDKLYKRALRLTGREEEAQDLVQEALVRAWRFWHTFTPGTGLNQWLYTILRNTFSTRYQRANRRQEMLEALKEEPSSFMVAEDRGPEGALEMDETCLKVREAVEALPEQYREAVRLVDLEGLSYREVAETLGCPQGTVMSRLFRGRKQLATLLNGV